VLQTDLLVDEMAIEIQGNNEVIGCNTHLNDINNITNVRNVFETIYIPKRNKIFEQEQKIISRAEYPFDKIHDGCKGVISNSYRTIISTHLIKPFIFKYHKKGKEIKLAPAYSYHIVGLIRSLSKTIMADESIEIYERAKRTAYILYDYWFHTKENIKDISFSVRTDLKNIISYIIESSYNDTYKHLDTTAMVEALRLKLNAEELLASNI
jgi:hypothetical protein